MSAELVGGAAAWLAHAAWYLANPRRGVRLLPLLASRPWLWSVGRLAAALLALIAGRFWIHAHGVAIGACCALAALTAAASINTIVAPLSSRALLGLSFASLLLLLLGGLQVLLGA